MKIEFSPLSKKIGLALALILFVFAAGLFYVNKILLPIQVKGLAIKAAEDALKRDVAFDTLQYSPLRGFIITDLVISEKDTPEKIFLKAKSVSAQVLFFALLQKKVLIPSLNINAPEIALTRTGKDTWNFSDLLASAPTEQTAAAAPMDVIISGLRLSGGQIILTDISQGEQFTETINIPSIKGSLSLTAAVQAAGEILLPSTNGSLKFDVRLGLRDRSFKGSFKTRNIAVDRYLRFSPVALPVDIRKLTLDESDITIMTHGGNMNISGNIAMPLALINLSDGTTLGGNILLTKAIADMHGKDITLQGTLLANTISVSTPAGLKANIASLRGADIQASIKDGKTAAAFDIDIKGTDISLNAVQKIKGDITLRRTSLAMNGTAIEAGTDITLKDALIDLPGVSINAEINAPSTKMSFDTGKIDLVLDAAFKQLTVKTGDVTLSGMSGVKAHMTFDPQAATPLNYSGAINIPGLNLSGLPTIGEIKDLRGTIILSTGQAALKDVNFSVLGTPVKMDGTITDLEAPRAEINVKADNINLSLVEKIIPDIVKEQGLVLKGSASADVRFAGLLAKAQDARITATARLTDVSVESRKLKQSASDINGLIIYQGPSSLSWKELSLHYQGKTWSSSGSLENLLNPMITASLRTDDLTADIKATKDGETLAIQSLTGTYFDSGLNLNGKIFIPAGKAPRMAVTGECKLSLRDLPKMLPPEQAKQIEALKLAGILKIKAAVQGDPQNWQELTSTLEVSTPALYMMGYQMADLKINAEQKNGVIDPLSIAGRVYGGALDVASTVKLKDKGLPFDLTLRLNDTSLELLKKDTPLKNQQMSGQLSAKADIKGALMDIRNMTGTASVKVTNGYLWDLEIVSRVLSIISASFKGGDIIITDASATFKITDQKVMTDDLALKSATITLGGEGWVDFDQNIDLNISPRLEANTSGSAMVSPLDAFNPTAGLVNIRVYNKLTAPKFEHNITAPQIIKKTLQNTVGTLFKLFE